VLDLNLLMREFIGLVSGILRGYGIGGEDQGVGGGSMQSDKQILEFGMSTIQAILIYDESCFEEFCGSELKSVVEEFLMEGIFSGWGVNVRKVFANFMYILTIFREERVGCWLLDLLRESMPKQDVYRKGF
jgi:hypothetical protein